MALEPASQADSHLWEPENAVTRFHFFTLAAFLATSGCAARPAPDARTAILEVRRGQSPEELFERGRAFAEIGDLTRGEQYLSAALAAGGDPARTLPALLRVCVDASRYRVAGEYIAQYLERHPEDVGLHLLRGLFEASVGDRDVALKEFAIVLREAPEDSEGHYAMAVLLRDEWADGPSANEHFRAYLRLSPNGAHAAQARAFLQEGVP